MLLSQEVGGQSWVEGVINAQRCRAEAAAQQAAREGHLGGKRKRGERSRRQERIDVEGIEEQRASYPAKEGIERFGETKPDLATHKQCKYRHAKCQEIVSWCEKAVRHCTVYMV